MRNYYRQRVYIRVAGLAMPPIRPLFLFLLLMVSSRCQSQFRPAMIKITPSDTVGYAFLLEQDNSIQQVEHLKPLFDKLFEQRTRGGKVVQIVHVGDSHILGNQFTSEVRNRLQRAFGDAGRGLVFPYKLAGTQGPTDYQTESNIKWHGSSCQKTGESVLPIGVSGFRIETTNSNGFLTFRMRDTATAETKLFTKITVFHHKTDKSYDIAVSDDLTAQTARLVASDAYSQIYYFDRPVSQVTLSSVKKSIEQKVIRIDGISLENELSGVVYHSIGVNGATAQDFLRAGMFAKQVAALNPDLIVLSFGTNESQGKMDEGYLYRSLEQLVNNLLEHAPHVRFLLTTPADSYLRGRGLNPYMQVTSEVIRRFARDNQLACWDLYTLSGGENSAVRWKEKGLMTSDSVHYTRSGYGAQGKLFYQSFIKGYNEAVMEKP
jgi:lysophospholipase L1-like esterase